MSNDPSARPVHTKLTIRRVLQKRSLVYDLKSVGSIEIEFVAPIPEQLKTITMHLFEDVFSTPMSTFMSHVWQWQKTNSCGTRLIYLEHHNSRDAQSIHTRVPKGLLWIDWVPLRVEFAIDCYSFISYVTSAHHLTPSPTSQWDIKAAEQKIKQSHA